MIGEVKNDVIKCYHYKYYNIIKLLNRITDERSDEANSRDGEEAGGLSCKFPEEYELPLPLLLLPPPLPLPLPLPELELLLLLLLLWWP